ncbi:MAG TPA: LCCL domain-containing protein [Thermoanaerobaculia bacterium]|nr:LCCL domain-containing protein [Thermoanaerobaculia bacterium]
MGARGPAVTVLAMLLLASGAVAADIPPSAKKLITDYEGSEQQIREEAEAKLRARREKLFQDLQKLQSDLAQKGDLDGAVAVRETLRNLRSDFAARGVNARPDPGNLSAHANAAEGTVLYFRVTGTPSGGAVWGSNPYTTDSNLAKAAVHAGAVRAGETAVVKVTIVAGQPKYAGSTKNGVTTSSWGRYGKSYRVERPQ